MGVVIRFSFDKKSQADLFQRKLEELGVTGSRQHMLAHFYTVSTDTRTLQHAAALESYIHRITEPKAKETRA